ncbi:MAG: FxsA family protein [Rhizobiales bacterium]|nr:FxsA family protein [Hyphomicrobiales bacterium]
MSRLVLPLIFIGIPLIEIALFVIIGDRIGVLWTIVIVIATAIAGTSMLRMQGAGALANARNAMESGQLPVESVADGIFLLIAGILLLTPGFLTDFIGFLLFIPSLRHGIGRAIWQKLSASGNIDIRTNGGNQPGPGGFSNGPVIDGEIVADENPPENDTSSDHEEQDPPSGDPRPDSPWRNN